MTNSNKPKEIKLRAFRIENKEISKSNSGLLALLSERLEKSTAKDRIMRLNQDDSNKEEDLIIDYQIKNNIHTSGTMLRIMDSSDSPSIPDDLFDNAKINISSLDSLDTGNSKVYKDHYYFLLNNDYVITNLAGGSTVARLQTYINWILEKERGETLFELTPLTIVHNDLKIDDIKSIKIQDPTSNKSGVANNFGSKKISDLSKEFILGLMRDVKSLSEIELEKIVSAELLIRFKKSKDISKEEYQKILGAYMKPISDTENVIFVPKKGSPIKGSEILRIKIVKIETTETNKVSEPQLLQEMESFLTDIQNE